MSISGTSSVLILISIVFASIAPSSAGNKVTDTKIRQLCSKTSNLMVCYKLLKSDHRTANVDAKGLAEISVDLAYNKANKVHSQLNSFAKAVQVSHLRNIYNLCTKNYEDAIHDLEVAKKNLKSGAYKNMPIQVKDAFEEIKSCENVLNGATSTDDADIKKKNQDVKFLVSIVKVTADNLNKNTMFIALLLAFAIPSSLGHRDDSDKENDLRDLCSQVKKSKECLDIIKSEFRRFEDTDCKGVAGPVIDLAREKAEEIRDMLNGLHKDSRDDKLKDKYISCSKNYNDASRDLDLAKRYFDSNDYQHIPVQVDEIEQELKNCKREFNKDAFDPAHIRNRSKEFRVYVDLVKVAIDRLLKKNDRN
ncbi:hypothetical protein BUALT_Bualt03G0011200 [Buddleja alternifolia]|uniref:Pectinesterase inhibitor domain-containing protein n=1 Tax=Buddleja alternifolia TaxID=168488 RepID=A0AAV6XXM6_9LAMI|nr:hypothetical protein BUALT_Bualt03G0011200 [Buddleja alternifolia]